MAVHNQASIICLYDCIQAVSASRQFNCSVCNKQNAGFHCSRSKVFKYCSLECQKKDWPSHRGICKALSRQLDRNNNMPILTDDELQESTTSSNSTISIMASSLWSLHQNQWSNLIKLLIHAGKISCLQDVQDMRRNSIAITNNLPIVIPSPPSPPPSSSSIPMISILPLQQQLQQQLQQRRRMNNLQLIDPLEVMQSSLRGQQVVTRNDGGQRSILRQRRILSARRPRGVVGRRSSNRTNMVSRGRRITEGAVMPNSILSQALQQQEATMISPMIFRQQDEISRSPAFTTALLLPNISNLADGGGNGNHDSNIDTMSDATSVTRAHDTKKERNLLALEVAYFLGDALLQNAPICHEKILSSTCFIQCIFALGYLDTCYEYIKWILNGGCRTMKKLEHDDDNGADDTLVMNEKNHHVFETHGIVEGMMILHDKNQLRIDEPLNHLNWDMAINNTRTSGSDTNQSHHHGNTSHMILITILVKFLTKIQCEAMQVFATTSSFNILSNDAIMAKQRNKVSATMPIKSKIIHEISSYIGAPTYWNSVNLHALEKQCIDLIKFLHKEDVKLLRTVLIRSHLEQIHGLIDPIIIQQIRQMNHNNGRNSSSSSSNNRRSPLLSPSLSWEESLLVGEWSQHGSALQFLRDIARECSKMELSE